MQERFVAAMRRICRFRSEDRSFPAMCRQAASVSLVHGDAAAAAGGMILPLSAIYQTGDKPQVWVVTDDHTVTLKTVSVEEFGDDKVRVHGLDPADQVVIAGVHKLRDGQQVRTEDSQ